MKSDLVKLRHARSTKDFPGLHLEDNEYVELSIKRSKVGLILIWAGEAVAIMFLLVVIAIMTHGSNSGNFMKVDTTAQSFLDLIVYTLFGVLIIAGLVASHVYSGNFLYVTNKRLIHQSMTSLFAKSTNVIELLSIEDVSFKQAGLVEYLFRLGTIRMSTVGDESTYTFKFIDAPTDELDIITHLVHLEKEKTKETYRRDAIIKKKLKK